MSGKPFICAHGDDWRTRFAKWWMWYGCFEHVPSSTKRYMRNRMLAEIPLTAGDRIRVSRLYSRAAANGLQVDHIHELALGGLHVPCNLQALTVAEHRAKPYGAVLAKNDFFMCPITGQGRLL